MLTVRCLSPHGALALSISLARAYGGCLRLLDPLRPLRCRRFISAKAGKAAADVGSVRRRFPNTRAGNRDAASPRSGSKAIPDLKEPSLIELLFPEESRRYEAQQRERTTREIPRLPIETPAPLQAPQAKARRNEEAARSSDARNRLLADVESSGSGTSVLVLRNASINLTEDDFRRLIPQGRHIEGWTLDQGDILKIIPARDLRTLTPQNVYYLLFSSPLSAFTYQGHVTRIHSLAAIHTPSSISSPIPPPPGYMIEGLDIHSAIQAYTLVPPTQQLELRQLKPPLTSFMQSLVRHQGYRHLLQRDGRMPFEVRLTMEGPQLQPSAVRHIMMETGKTRALSWSGGENLNPKITRWVARSLPSALDPNDHAKKGLHEAIEYMETPQDAPEPTKSNQAGDQSELKRRPPQAVYVVGFHTEKAAQSFIRCWHRRPLEVPGDKSTGDAEGDLPPIANVDLLW